MDNKEFIFNLKTPLGFFVHCSREYWDFITTQKHPSLKNGLKSVMTALTEPDEIRKSKKDPSVYLFYGGRGSKWICAVAKSENEKEGFLITAYHADIIKSGEIIWTKSR